ncbi:MAG: hypothetical protein A3F13_04365 [Gammaproteobacteria bacterium RIFCSPHIGHO2_12_FULL_40_19]|nr:MAG: hypothetical protein A3F13_04365 [Gammaproteobacteria bacterium RIFCSPHIGHO2_12_FULL_40_19]
MVDSLLNCRDSRGYPVIKLSYADLNLDHIIKAGDTDILELLLDLRHANGETVFSINKFNVGASTSLLDVAIFGKIQNEHNFFDDVHPIPHMIEFLLDRGARPTAFQREIFKTSPFFKNLEQQQREHNIALPEWVERVLAAQPLTAEEIVSNERAIKQNIERVNELVRGATTEVARINQNTQNIHLPETERSVDLAIHRLQQTYADSVKPSFQMVRQSIIEEIEKLRKGNIYTPKDLDEIRFGLDYVSENTTNAQHGKSGLYLRDIIVLVWMGANDPKKLPLDAQPGIDIKTVITMRRLALLDKLKETATAYPDRKNPVSCLGGTRNFIVSSLDKAHPDVIIAPTQQAIRELVLEFIKRQMLSELKTKTLKDQKSIIRCWESVEDQNPADQFRAEIKDKLLKSVAEHLGSVFPDGFADELNDYYDNLPMPILHGPLFALVDEINKLPDELDEEIVLTLKNAAKEVFQESNPAFDREFQLHYESYLQSDELDEETVLELKNAAKEVFQENNLSFDEAFQQLFKCYIQYAATIAELQERPARDEIKDAEAKECKEIVAEAIELQPDLERLSRQSIEANELAERTKLKESIQKIIFLVVGLDAYIADRQNKNPKKYDAAIQLKENLQLILAGLSSGDHAEATRLLQQMKEKLDQKPVHKDFAVSFFRKSAFKSYYERAYEILDDLRCATSSHHITSMALP